MYHPSAYVISSLPHISFHVENAYARESEKYLFLKTPKYGLLYLFVCFIFSIHPICQSKWVRYQTRMGKKSCICKLKAYAKRRAMPLKSI